MSIFKGIGKALGFGGNSEEDESIFTPYDKSQPSSYINPFKKEDNEPKAEPISFVPDTKPEEKAEPAALAAPASGTVAPAEMPTQVLDGMLDIINSNLPDIVKQSIDEDAERRALVEAIGPQFSNYLNAVRDAAITMAKKEWIIERSKLVEARDEAKAH